MSPEEYLFVRDMRKIGKFEMVAYYLDYEGLQTLVTTFYPVNGSIDAELSWLKHLRSLPGDVLIRSNDGTMSLEDHLYGPPPEQFQGTVRDDVMKFVLQVSGVKGYSHWDDLEERLLEIFDGDLELARETFDRYNKERVK